MAISLRADNVSLCYTDGGTESYALREVSLELSSPGFYGIIGPSGSGKSSLLYLLSGLKQPTEGKIVYDNVDIGSMGRSAIVGLRKKEFGFVFQQPFLIGYLTAEENIMLAANNPATAQSDTNSLLARLGMTHLAKRTPAKLSGGERQRLVVARSMIHCPNVIFADEPTAALDRANGNAVIELLKSYRSDGTVIVVTHDPTILEGADCVYKLASGRLVETV